MYEMFAYANKFDQPLDNWDVSRVENMHNMFKYAVQFDQSIATWDIDSVTNMAGMFESAGISTPNYDSTLMSWSQQDVQFGIDFHAGNSQFCLSEDARDYLIDTMSWNITDGGQECTGIATTWIGAVDTDWFNASNWSHGVPTSSIVAWIPYVDTGFFPVINGMGAQCSGIKCTSGASLTVSSGYNLSLIK